MSRPTIIRTEAVVLRSLEYGETSQIITLFTRNRGRLSVMARGSRRVKSKFGSTLQPMSHIDGVVYYKPNRQLQTLTEATHVARYSNLARDLEKITIGLRLVELVSAMMEDGDAQQDVFELLINCLAGLNAEHENPGNLLPFFQLRLADLMGFAPSFEKQSVENLASNGGSLILEDGNIGPPISGRDVRTASRKTLRAFAVFARATQQAACRMTVDQTTAAAVQSIIESYFRYHIESVYPTRAANVTSQLFRSN